MRTVKLVVIGASGVGKSSVRNQYISGRFTTGYRATIGADFITKTVPHHSRAEEQVTLQIWDTAGQERFSGLSSAFFRGADAVILMFDVNQPRTLAALTKWWDDFRDKAPVPDDALEEFCFVFVGNKIDMTEGPAAHEGVVTETEARDFIHTLVPHPSTPPSPSVNLAPPDVEFDDYMPEDNDDDELAPSDSEEPTPQMTSSIDIAAPRRSRRTRTSRASRSHSRSTLFRGGGTVGTMTTTHSIYHTPSSSLFDTFESALSSPAPASLASPSRGPARRMPSTSSMSSAPTITPSLFVRGRAATTSATTPASGSPPSHSHGGPPPPPERFPKLFFTSAKTGEGVKDVFEYVARRVVVRHEYEEALEARTMQVREANQRTSIHLSGMPPDRRWAVRAGSCCRT